MTTRYQKIAMVAYAVGLMLFRSPVLFTTPRFWAEEGQQYFSYAWSHSFFDNMTSQFFGYYTLVPNLAASLATLVPLEHAPLLTTCIALLIQTLVCSIVIFGKSPYWDSFWKKIAVITAILALSQPETWANTITSMFWLGLGTVCILLENSELLDRGMRNFQRGMLAIGGLTGVVSCFVTPVYLLKACRTRAREDYYQTGILCACSLLQGAVFLNTYLAKGGIAGRLAPDGLNLFQTTLRHFVWPFIGNYWENNEGLVAVSMKINLLFQYFDIYTAAPYIPQGIILLPAMLFFLYLVVVRMPNRNVQELVLVFIITSLLSTLLSISMASGNRYVFVPSFCLFLLAYGAVAEGGRPWLRAVSLGLVGVMFVSTLYHYRVRMLEFTRAEWPVWSEEVKVWKNDLTHALRVWPLGDSWVVRLERKGRVQ